MTDALVSEWARGRLANYDGETIGVLAVDGDGAAAAVDTMAFVSEVVAYEIDRGTALASVDQVGSVGVLNVATALLDTSAGTPAGVWFFDNSTGADATRRLLSFLPTIEAAGFVDWPAAAPDGIGTWRAAAPTTATTAASVAVDATGFAGNLSGTDTDVQTALETIDAMAVGSGGGTAALDIMPVFVYVDESYGDPEATPVNLTADAYAYFFTDRTATGSTAEDPWEFAGLYVGTSPDIMTASEPVRCTTDLQPVSGRVYFTRTFLNWNTVDSTAGDPLADSGHFRSGYISPNNGIDSPVFSIMMEYPQPDGITAGAEFTTDEDFPVLGAKFTGNLAALTDDSQLSDALAVVDDLTGSGIAGPASSTIGHLAVWDDTTGDTLDDGGAVTAAGLAILDDADATAQRATLGTGGILAGQDEKTGPATTATETSLLTSAPTVTATAGEVVRIVAAGTYVQNSGGTTTPTIRLKLGGTPVLSWSQSFTNSATVREWEITATLRVQANGDVNGSGTMIALNALMPCDTGTSSAAIQSGVTLDLTWQHGSATSTQTVDLAYYFVERVRAI